MKIRCKHIITELLNINFDYLYEDKHIGNQDYFKTELNLKNNEKGH